MLWLVLVAILLGNSLHVQKIVHIGGASGKGSTHQCSRCKRYRFDPWVAKIPWRRKWQPTPVFLPRKSQGQRSLASYSPWDRKESDITKCAHTHTHTQI